MKYYVVTDVHGYYDELRKALTEKGWEDNNPEHVLVSLGDLLDRGHQPLECLDFINQLPKERKILIKGNHEDLMESLIHRGTPAFHDYSNGTFDTILDCLNLSESKIRDFVDYEKAIKSFGRFESWNKYIKSCIDYYELENNIFVHGWIYPNKSLETTTPKEWSDARWLNGMDMWSQGYILKRKVIWCGHWHTSYGHVYLHRSCVNQFAEDSIFTPFKDEGIVAMDSCVAYSGFINCEVIEL